MPKHHKNGDVKNETSTGAENGAKKSPKKSQKQPSKKTKKTTDQNSKKRGCPSEYANKVKPYLADIARYTRCGVTMVLDFVKRLFFKEKPKDDSDNNATYL